MGRMKKVFLTGFLLILTGCSEESTRLDSSQLAQLFSVEQTASFQSLRFTGSVLLKIDKSAVLNIPALGDDTGIWWIDGNKLCSKWKQAAGGKTACAHISKFPDGTFAGHDPTTGLKIGAFSLNP